MATKETKPVLVIDANVLIKHENLQALQLQYDLCTPAAVIPEIKDTAARARLASISSTLKVENPDKAAQDQVAQFAKKTGDFISLSSTDLQVIALAYMKLREADKLAFLRDSPLPVSNFKAHMEGDATEAGQSDEEEEEEPEVQEQQPTDDSSAPKDDPNDTKEEKPEEKTEGKTAAEAEIETYVDPDEPKNGDDDGWMTVAKPKKEKEHKKHHKHHNKRESEIEDGTSETLSSNILSKSLTVDHELDKAHPQLWYENRDFEPNEEEGWITPSNLSNIMQGAHVAKGSMLKELGVGVMTVDYAMQVRVLSYR
jgi:rRNA maturation endonuclease Nob1